MGLHGGIGFRLTPLISIDLGMAMKTSFGPITKNDSDKNGKTFVLYKDDLQKATFTYLLKPRPCFMGSLGVTLWLLK